MKIDPAYQERFTDGLIELIMRISIVEAPGQPRAAVIHAAAIIDSMLSMIAMLSATSAECTTPAKTRALCDQIASKLQKRINAAKLEPSPFETISPRGTN